MRWKRLILIICIIFSLITAALTGQEKRHQVLLLNSYHKGYIWCDEITRGVEETILGEHIDLNVEYMDTKRLYDESYLDLLEKVYREKYKDHHFDAVITSDNIAFNFYQERGKNIFKNAPHIFCGYNFLKPSDLEGFTNITGVNEQANLSGNLSLIESIHPDAEKIIIIADDTVTGKQIQKEVELLNKERDPSQPALGMIYHVSKKELIEQVRNLPPHTVILFTFFFVDREGATLFANEMTALVSDNSSVPVYGAWNFSLGHGIIGGYLVNGISQGKEAAQMAIKVIQGIAPDEIPVTYETPYNLIFDFNQLNRFQIPLKNLPKEGLILYKPSTFYSRNIKIIWTMVLIFIMLLTIILVLILNIQIRKKAQKELAEQSEFLRLIIAHIPSLIYWKDRDFHYQGCNQAFAESHEILEKDEIIGKTDEYLNDDKEEIETLKWEDETVMNSGRPILNTGESIVDNMDRKIWYLTNRIPIKNDNNEVIGILGIKTDISEIKKSQIELKKTEKKLRTIIDAVPSLIYIKDGDGRFLMANKMTADTLGFSLRDLEESPQQRLKIDQKETEDMLADDSFVLETGRPLNKVQQNIFLNHGKESWFQTNKILCPPYLFDSPAVLGVSMDITSLKMAEEELRKSEEYLQTTLNSIGDGVISTDKEGLIVQINPEAEKLTGWTRKEALGQPLSKVVQFHKMDSEELLPSPIENILEKKESSTFGKRVRLYSKEGSKSSITSLCTPILNDLQQIGGAVIVLHDLTDEMAIQEQLRHSEKMDTLGKLAGGITHDFNNMLGGIIGASQLLKQYISDDENAQNYYRLIVETAQRAADLTKELLIFSRKTQSHSKPFNILEDIRGTVELLKRTLDRRISIEVNLPDEDYQVAGDPSQIQSALMNLGINASHAMPSGGEILIKTEKVHLNRKQCSESFFTIKPGPYIKIDLSDTGSGIPEKILPRIFDPFFTTKEKGQGTGLGLSAVFRTIEQHKGAISVESEINRGTTFSLFLPLTSTEEKEPKEQEIEAISGSGHILIIDDDTTMRITAQEILKGLGYQVSSAVNGMMGLEYYRKDPSIDLVLLDMIMPEMNGKDCFLALKNEFPDVRVILTSGFIQPEDLELMNKEGLNGFCHKPYTVSQLSTLINEVLKK